MMGDNVKVGVDFEDGLSGHESFGFTFMLLFEEELTIEVGELG